MSTKTTADPTFTATLGGQALTITLDVEAVSRLEDALGIGVFDLYRELIGNVDPDKVETKQQRARNLTKTFRVGRVKKIINAVAGKDAKASVAELKDAMQGFVTAFVQVVATLADDGANEEGHAAEKKGSSPDATEPGPSSSSESPPPTPEP